MKNIVLFFVLISSLYSNTLQETIDKSSPYSTLKLSSGVYLGKITINSSNVILKNLIITDSGNRMDTLDSAIVMTKVNNCEISNCKLLNSLYGIYMNMVQDSIIANNHITSKDNFISLKGDALKV